MVLCACTTPPPSSSPEAATNATGPTGSTSSRLLAEARTFSYRVRNTACLDTGSSFATKDGVITNRHVAIGSSSVDLSTWNGDDFDATVGSISEEPGADLAVLSGRSGGGLAALDTKHIPAGTSVWAAGYPEGDQLSLSSGIVLDYASGSAYGEPEQVMELTNAVKPGNSGSPLLDSEGQVVGVVFALNTVTGNGVAIPASTLEQFLKAPGGATEGQCAE
jgi:S1-C subfamily serine protease